MTTAAIEQAKIIRAEADKETQALRISVKGGGCSGFTYSMKFDSPGDNDVEFNLDGLDVIIDGRSYLYLKGTTINFKSGIMGSGFSFENPNAKKTCGCGNSFGA